MKLRKYNKVKPLKTRVSEPPEEYSGSPGGSEIIIYTAGDSQTQVEVKFEVDTVWLTQQQMAVLFQRDQSVISRHIKNVFKEGELIEKSNVQKMHNAFSDRPTALYNLEVIISIGYRVNSKRGTQFRQWATHRLKDYLVKGYAINEKRLKASQQQLTDLKKSLSLLENVVKQKQLSSDEAIYSQYVTY